jgi:hypothetical protein
LTESVRNALGCLGSAPEPFSAGGVYLNFCLKHAAKVHVTVFDPQGATLWDSEARVLAVGQHQWWFDGTDKGRDLPPGPYLFQVQADYGGGRRESRQGTMTRERPRRR